MLVGLEWRAVTAGENKLRMDPFRPLREEDVVWTQKILEQIHQNFIALVKDRRPKVRVHHKTVFTGDVFTGQDSISVGLADGLCSDLRALCIERYGKDVKFERCEPRPSFLSGLTNFRSEIKVDVSVDDILDALAVRQHEAKYGL